MWSLVGVKLFIEVAVLILLYSGIICCNNLNITLLDTIIGIYAGLFHLSSKIIVSFYLLFEIGAILFFILYYPRRSQKSIGTMRKKIDSFFLTKFRIVIFAFIGIIFFCSDISLDPCLLCSLVPIKIYENADG
jgi:hypothetical protein